MRNNSKYFYQDSSIELRRIEKAVFDNVIVELKSYDPGFSTMREAALDKMEQLWLVMLEDVVHPGNLLSDELKGKLVSVGIWVIKECYALRCDSQKALDQLIDINEIISDSLS